MMLIMKWKFENTKVVVHTSLPCKLTSVFNSALRNRATCLCPSRKSNSWKNKNKEINQDLILNTYLVNITYIIINIID